MAGMDKSVVPGDDFNAYTNGGWIKTTPIPADKSSYGVFAILADETRKRMLSLIQESAEADPPPAGTPGKSAISTRASWTKPAIESKGIAPLKPQLDAIAAIADRHDLARVLGRRLRADVDPLNNTNFETENLFGVWVAQGLRTRRTTFPICSRADSECRTAITISRRLRRWPECARSTRRISRRCSSWRVSLTHRPRGSRVRARNEDGGGACHARRIGGRACARFRGSATNWPPGLPGSTGRRCSTRPD